MIQAAPRWVILLDEYEIPGPRPVLQALLPLQRGTDVVERLDVDVKPGVMSSRCSPARLARLFVTPM